MAATILVADDSATMRMIVQATLTGAGWKVLTAGNGQEALEVAKSHPVDLVVSDWNMPVMGGLQLIQGLREQEQY
ncbi:response regulator, partial [Streptomyces sp. AC04842]|nr:response regulator [Streptomyces sp. AC04842]